MTQSTTWQLVDSNMDPSDVCVFNHQATTARSSWSGEGPYWTVEVNQVPTDYCLKILEEGISQVPQHVWLQDKMQVHYSDVPTLGPI